MARRPVRWQEAGRLAALRQQAEPPPPPRAEVLLEDALLDTSARVRELARATWVAWGLPPRCFSDFYRARLAIEVGPRWVAALRGLGETSGDADAATFLAHLEDPRARVRRAALAGLSRCEPMTYLPCVVRALADPRPAVARAARCHVRLRLGKVVLAKLQRRITSRAGGRERTEA